MKLLFTIIWILAFVGSDIFMEVVLKVQSPAIYLGVGGVLGVLHVLGIMWLDGE